MRVLRDVVVNRIQGDELLAVSQAPAIAGEDMSLDLVGGGSSMELRVRVIESRPVIIDGSVRHRIRLSLIPATAEIELSEAPLVEIRSNAGVEAI
jgi:hypothetical protein